MCLLVVAIDSHPRLPLIVAGNRDEFHVRPTREAHWWPDYPDIVGGRDLQAGGTWLAMSRSGRFAAVTNYRDAQHETGHFRSRGRLITDFLTGVMPSLDYLESIDGSQYAGFNLLVADGADAAYLSNRGAPMRRLAPGVYGLSNATLDEAWTKVTRSRSRLETLIADDAVDEASLFILLNANSSVYRIAGVRHALLDRPDTRPRGRSAIRRTTIRRTRQGDRRILFFF
jgi:uncharacterized protein with NRDE domain